MACAPMTAVDQDARVARAMREEFTFTQHNPGEWIVETAAGNAYLTSETSCTCGDWLYRCSKGDCRCKHQVALGQQLIAEGATLCAKGLRMVTDDEPEAPAYPLPEDFTATSARLSGALNRNVIWGEKDQRAFDRIFG